MQDQSYAIMRNTRTLESYRAWERWTWRWGMPLIIAAIVPLTLGGVFIGKALISGRPDGYMPGGGLLSLASLLMGAGALLIALRRKSHPWVAPE